MFRTRPFQAPFRISVSFDHAQAQADCALVPGLKQPNQRGGRGRWNKKVRVPCPVLSRHTDLCSSIACDRDALWFAVGV